MMRLTYRPFDGYFRIQTRLLIFGWQSLKWQLTSHIGGSHNALLFLPWPHHLLSMAVRLFIYHIFYRLSIFTLVA